MSLRTFLNFLETSLAIERFFLYTIGMKAWKHVLESENLGIVIAPSRRSAERAWKNFYPQSEPEHSEYFLEETKDFSEMHDSDGTVKDWNDQLSRRDLMEHNRSHDEYLCPLSAFGGSSCKYCLSWTICAYNELTDFLVDETGKLCNNPDNKELSSGDFERRQAYEAKQLKQLRESEEKDREEAKIEL